MLRVLPSEGDPTRYFVESNELQCTVCSKLFKKTDNRSLRVGDGCPVAYRCGKCGRSYLGERHRAGERCPHGVRRAADLAAGVQCPVEPPCSGVLVAGCSGKIDVRFHTVDIALFCGNGMCSCEFFQFSCQPKLVRLPPDEQGAGRHRCGHVKAARDFALDLSLRAHEVQRHAAHGRGRREEVTA